MQNVSPPSLRAVVYSRVSTEAQVEGTSLDHQEKESLRWCREHAAQVVDVIRDEGVSGAAFLTRPGIQRALALIRSAQANTLVCHRVDRAARDARVLLTIRDEVRRAGGRLIFSDGTTFGDDATGDAMLGVTGVMSGWQKGIIREQTMRGRTDLLKLGIQVCRSRFPYGYRIVRKNDVIRGEREASTLGSYEIVEEQARLVAWMFEQYAAGASLYRIAVGLTEQGVPAPRTGGRWNIGTVKNILANPVYKGMPVVRKWQRLEDEARVGSHQHGRTLQNKHYFVPRRDASELIELAAPPVVSEELWNRCQELRAIPKRLPGGRPDARSLLTTLMKCPACGRGLTAYKRYYRCHHVARTATHPCEYRKHFHREPYDAAVLAAIRRLSDWKHLEKQALAAYSRMKARKRTAPEDSWDRLRADEAVLAKRERATVEAQIAGIQQGADPAIYSRLFAEMAAERQRLESRRLLLAETQQPFDMAVLLTAAERIQKACGALSRVLQDDRVPMAEKRQGLRSVVERVEITEDGVAIYFVGLDQPVPVRVAEKGSNRV